MLPVMSMGVNAFDVRLKRSYIARVKANYRTQVEFFHADTTALKEFNLDRQRQHVERIDYKMTEDDLILLDGYGARVFDIVRETSTDTNLLTELAVAMEIADVDLWDQIADSYPLSTNAIVSELLIQPDAEENPEYYV